ncbi:uncharacterized protein LOC126795720 [Argentina anserina]|uniref:uncharacterized protein LOC126795720 n=1 Tax=Argentina anserina TaxID=57926 RepID=UPI0021764F66|nr:uncharacterized protein LOC126795720 [Potentilla anserina]
MDFQYHSFANVQDSGHDNNEGVSQKASKRPSRGPSFNPYEDQLLVSAWLNTGLDPITAAVNLRNESSKTELDKLADAKQLYEAQESSKFNLDHAWILLRHQPKWIQLNEELNIKTSKKKSKPHISSSKLHIPTSSVRPPGKKAEKRKLKETSDQMELIQKLLLEKKKEMKKKLAIMKDKFEVDKEKLRVRKAEADNRKFEAEMRVMSMDTFLMNSEQRAYYSKMQMKILHGD